MAENKDIKAENKNFEFQHTLYNILFMLGFINEVILLVIVGTKVTLIHIHVILPRQRKLNF